MLFSCHPKWTITPAIKNIKVKKLNVLQNYQCKKKKKKKKMRAYFKTQILRLTNQMPTSKQWIALMFICIFNNSSNYTVQLLKKKKIIIVTPSLFWIWPFHVFWGRVINSVWDQIPRIKNSFLYFSSLNSSSLCSSSL